MAESFPKIQIIEGIPVSVHCNVETFRSALKYKAQPDDIFLVVYPKSGTTWMQVILYTLMNDGKPFDTNMAEYFARTPSLELIGERGMKNMHRPCAIKTHLPFNRVPYNENAKYICAVRNPKDPSFNDSNPSTALYNAIETSFQFLLRNKLTGLFTDDSNRNRIILSTDGEDVNSIKSSLIQACEQTKQNKFVKIGIQTC
ncbi:unnamed protein product [Rotaria sordida]|uniref:Sulfotransferase domain-containing protein n=1 Tax=Rotaria sordida TaxID=392033 RepID=A0A814NY32_9BILA|nr:unnamed protein product [Rotaria sordida]